MFAKKRKLSRIMLRPLRAYALTDELLICPFASRRPGEARDAECVRQKIAAKQIKECRKEFPLGEIPSAAKNDYVRRQ
jgi:hypothetical protein